MSTYPLNHGALLVGTGGGDALTGAEIVSEIDGELGNTDWQTAGSASGVTVDAANFTIKFLSASASFVEAGLVGTFTTQGTSASPNRVGDDTNTVVGSDYDGTHVAGADWNVADSAYVAGSADNAGIVGGYDCINNQLGAWISGSNHSVIAYHANGHSYIAGGGYNFTNSPNSTIIGSTASAVTGASSNSSIMGGVECLIAASTDAFLGGRNSETEAGASRSFGWGNSVKVQANHQNAVVFGQDVDTPGADSFTRGADQLETRNDVRVWRKTYRKTTTDATVGDMFYQIENFGAGKVYAGAVKVMVIALQDGGVNGANDGAFNQVAFEGVTSFLWDEDGNVGNFDGAADAASPSFSLTQIGTDKIGVGGVTVNLSTGLLRLRVTGKAATTIRWVAEMEVVSTCADAEI